MVDISMAEEIIKIDEIIIDKDGKKWLPVKISNEALSMLNKIVIGDNIDQDDWRKKKLETQVHEDCLRLFKEFN